MCKIKIFAFYLVEQWRECCFLCVLHLLPLQLLNPKSPFPNALLFLRHYQRTVPSLKTQRFPFVTLSGVPPPHSPNTKLRFWENPTTTPYLLCPKSTRLGASAAPEPPENSHCKTWTETLPYFLPFNLLICQLHFLCTLCFMMWIFRAAP